MTKKQVFALAEKHGMTMARDPITREGTGWYLQHSKLIPELDEMADSKELYDAAYPCYIERLWEIDDEYTYKLVVPRGWISLWD